MKNIILLNPSMAEPGSSGQDIGNRPSDAGSLTAARFLQQANAAFHEGDLPNAREALRSALAFRADDFELILALGHVEFGLEHYELALQRYSLVAEMNVDHAEAHSSCALALKILGRDGEAEAAAQRALSIDGDDLVALKVLTRIHLDAGRQGQARRFCRRILDLRPSDQEGLSFLDQCRFDVKELALEPTPATVAAGHALPEAVSIPTRPHGQSAERLRVV